MEITWFDIFALAVTTFVSAIAFIRWRYRYWERLNVPFLKPSFPMGNFETPWSTKIGFHSIVNQAYFNLKSKGYKYGGIFATLRPIFIPIDLDLVKCIVIKDFQHFVDRGFYYNEKTDPLSANLLSIEGDKWRSLRTRLTPTFTSTKMKYMFQTVVDCGAALESEIHKLYVKKRPVDVNEVGALFTTNVISSCAFGLDCDVFANPDSEFRSHSRDVFRGGLGRLIRTYSTLTFPKLCRILGVRMFEKHATDFYYNVIKEITQLRESGAVKRNDFVQLLVDIKNGVKKSEESFTFNEIAAQAFIFFLAGFETSSSTMTFAFYEMAKNQEVQDKVREEIGTVLGKHGGKITYEAITQMTYLGQVLDETFRMYPILPTLDRIVTKDFKVPGEDLILKKGTKILIPLRGIQNDPEYFPKPEIFDPDRFSPENKANHHVCAHMPFGEGPRICIGMRFGIMQSKIGIALMLKNYKYRISSEMPKMELSCKSPFLSSVGGVVLDIEKVD